MLEREQCVQGREVTASLVIGRTGRSSQEPERIGVWQESRLGQKARPEREMTQLSIVTEGQGGAVCTMSLS